MNIDAYRDKILARLAELQADVDKAKAKVDGASADLRIRAEQELEELQSAMEAARTRAQGIAEASEEKLAEIETRLGESLDDVRDRAMSLLGKFKNLG